MPQCIEHKNLQEYFREQVRAAIRHQGRETPEVVEYYLVNLLHEYSKTERVHGEDEPLALLFAKALEARLDDRIPLLKRLGDFSLYISGFFPESLSRKLVDVDYYIQMGETAYGALSELTDRRPHFPEVFGHLAERFVETMDILSEVSDQAIIKNDTGLLRLYEMWLKTGSDRLENRLTQEGIIPNRNLTTKLQ